MTEICIGFCLKIALIFDMRTRYKMVICCVPLRSLCSANKKAFQLNANHPLSDSPFFIVNKLKHVWEGEEQGPVQRGTGAAVLHIEDVGTLSRIHLPPPNRMKDSTEHITFVQLHCRAVIINEKLRNTRWTCLLMYNE